MNEIDLTPWQVVFLSSVVNGAFYVDPPVTGIWQFPTETWFQRRLREKREKEEE